MKKTTARSTPRILAASALYAALPMAALAADAPAKASDNAWVSWKKPAWLTDLSLGVKESYDSNLLRVNGSGTLREESSWVTTVSPKVGVNLAPLLGKDSVFQALSLSYAPDIETYHDADQESFTAHKFAGQIKGKSGAFSFNLDNSFTLIDGSKTAPLYPAPDNTRSAYATAVARERREQYQDRAKINFQYDWEKWFFRPTAALTYYDLRTDQKALAGYQNYADRYDVNGGADVGFKLDKNVALTLGYRYGHQYQEQFSPVIDATQTSSPSDYQRILFGFEGKPLKWLTVNFAMGPDFRNYEANSATHTTPVTKRHPVLPYGEAAITAAITADDSLAFKYRQWQWVSSTGLIPYMDSSFELAYKHKFTPKLSLDLGAKLGRSDYNRANTASGKRDDFMYSLLAGVGYNINANLAANLSYTANLGRNNQEAVVNPQYREFDQHLVALGLQWKF